ncbi:coiled-coil domain-containing protein 137 [Dunckerocampus dactyliophorus]|uniref:coiled-coil domain-containing protein 137 n=1 Tax=Dunckerocampus dactyliophorus TaxID=161453 RepID=UPI002406B9F9|nr:coiled-coil domain-containing protein 137 [Dunckerocampus dactyliophorus]
MERSTNCTKDSGKVVNNVGEKASTKKQKRDTRVKKDKQRDHLEHIPYRLQEIMKSKERMKTGAKKANNVKDAAVLRRKPEESEIGDIRVPHFKQRKREGVKQYLERMEMETKHVFFLTNNQVERKPELDADQQENPADQGKSKKKKEYNKLRLQKLLQKKLNRQEARVEKEMFQDDIPFGEVSMEPPSLTSKPKKAAIKSQKANRELLLNSLLGHSMASTTKPSMAKQRIMEEERERAVQAYRHLKKQKLQQQEQARTVKCKGPQ